MRDTAKILIVDDNAGIRTALSLLLEDHGLVSVCAASPGEALAAVRDDDIGVVVQDMNYSEDTTGGEEGVRLFREIHQHDPDLPILLMTAWTSLETAVQLVKEGAEDYFGKPWDDDKLVSSIQKLLNVRQLRLENRRLRAEGDRARRRLADSFNLCGLVYTSQAMQQVLALATSVARSDVAVLISGPHGSGKGLIAKIIQVNSRRSDFPFVTIDSGSIADEVFEAELFGTEPDPCLGDGSPAADRRREGMVGEAHSGTLLFDEVENLSPKGQTELLRFLQTGEFERWGSNVTQKGDVRILSASNTNLREATASGAFREELYFRLAVIEIQVPPLRDRVDDILSIAQGYLARLSAPDGKVRELSSAAREALLAYEWPGNVRELQNKLQRAVLVGQGPYLEPADLDLEASALSACLGADGKSVPPAERSAEAEEIEEALQRANGVISRAAADLGLSRQALYRRMARVGISVERRTLAKET